MKSNSLVIFLTFSHKPCELFSISAVKIEKKSLGSLVSDESSLHVAV